MYLCGGRAVQGLITGEIDTSLSCRYLGLVVTAASRREESACTVEKYLSPTPVLLGQGDSQVMVVSC